MPFPDEPFDVYQIWCQSVQLFESFPRLFNFWPPKNPKVPPSWLEGQFVWRISIPRWICTCVPNLVQIGQPFYSFSRHLNVWPLNPPRNAHVHSQVNPQTWTKVGANRSSCLTASPDFLIFDPLKTPKCPPPSCLEGQFVWRISFPRRICTCVPNLVPIGPAVW